MTENSNLDEKLKEFYLEWSDQKIDPVVQAIINECDEPLPRMLFLDDRTKRIEAARKKYTQQYDVTYVHNVKECLRYLCRQEFDIVSLDHDLDGCDFQNPDDVTSGMEVVRYIVKCGGFPPSQIVVPEVWIHSSNLLAANLMVSELLKVNIRAYFRRFEYEDEKHFGDAQVSRKPVVVEDKWKSIEIMRHCISCHNFLWINENHQCYDCYKRELIQCA